MSILILTAYTQNIEWGGYGENDFPTLAVAHNKEYASNLGYDFKAEVLAQKYKDFYPSWVKIPCILDNLPHYDYVCWIDADAIFYTNEGIEDKLGKSVCLTQAIPSNDFDKQFTLTSTGFMIFKNCEYSFNVLRNLLEQAETYRDGVFKQSHWHEQGLLDELFVKKEVEKAISKERKILLDLGKEKLSVPLLTKNFKILPYNYQECSENKDPVFIYHACADLHTRKERLSRAIKKWRNNGT